MKKLISVFVALVLMMSVLSGCKSGGREAGKMIDGKYVPASELKLEVWNTQGADYTAGAEIPDNVVEKWLYDKTLVNIETIYGNDGGQWDVKLSRLIAGDNMPHIIVCSSGQGPAHFAKLAKAKQLWEIDEDMLETYAPNLVKRIPKNVLEMLKIDGKLYGLPFDQPSNSTTNPGLDDETLTKIDEYVAGISSDENMALWIRDDILKKIYPNAKSWSDLEKIAQKASGPIADECFDIPITTKNEFIDFMYKIKSLNVTENGRPVFAFGYDGGDNWQALSYIGSAMMGYSPHFYTSTWNDREQKIVVPLVTDICKEAAKEQYKMVKDEVVDPESLVHTSDMYKENVMNGRYAIVAADSVGGAQTINSTLEQKGKNYRYRPFTVQIPNNKDYVAGKEQNYWNSTLCFTKEMTKEDVIQFLNYMNVCYSEDFEEVYWWGRPEDKLYVDNADGTRSYTDERFTKRFVDNDKSALDNKDTKGIGCSNVGSMYTPAVNTNQNMYAPAIYNKTFTMPLYKQVIKFPKNSEHAVNKIFPQKDVWDAPFSSVDECVNYWAEREKWESAFKMVFTAQNDEEFESKWKSAVDTVNSVANISEMEKKMTKIAREEIKTMK